MSNLAADQRITLIAFQSAIQTCKLHGIALPENIEQVSTFPEQHIDDLDYLSESDDTFEMLYQTARLALHEWTNKSKGLNF
jgi:hypothetical protein